MQYNNTINKTKDNVMKTYAQEDKELFEYYKFKIIPDIVKAANDTDFIRIISDSSKFYSEYKKSKLLQEFVPECEIDDLKIDVTLGPSSPSVRIGYMNIDKHYVSIWYEDDTKVKDIIVKKHFYDINKLQSNITQGRPFKITSDSKYCLFIQATEYTDGSFLKSHITCNDLHEENNFYPRDYWDWEMEHHVMFKMENYNGS